MNTIDAPTTGPAEDLVFSSPEQLAKQTEQTAINRIAKKEGLVTDIATEQKNVITELFGNAGTDGASMPVMKKAIEKVDEQAKIREARFDTGAQVADLPGNIIGQEDDRDRSVVIDDSMVSADTPEAQAIEVNRHEFRHKIQATSNAESEPVPLTGDQEVDALLQVDHTAFREEDAMFAAGDAFTAESYTTDYKAPVNRVAKYLNKRNLDGDRLVREAGLNGKMKEVRSAIEEAFTKEQIEHYRNN
jgi:hypothetical protein